MHILFLFISTVFAATEPEIFCGHLLTSTEGSPAKFCDLDEKRDVEIGPTLEKQVKALFTRVPPSSVCIPDAEDLVCVRGSAEKRNSKMYFATGDAIWKRPHPFARVTKNPASEPGIEWEPMTTVEGIDVAYAGDVEIVRVDPRKAKLVLLNQSEKKFSGTLSRVASDEGLVFATNASMFAEDQSTSIGYMRNFAHVNNGNKARGYYLVFNPKKKGLPAARIVANFAETKNYETVIQNWRTWKIKGEKSHNYNYTSQLGIDGQGNLFFFYTRRSYEMYELYAFISSLGLKLKEVLYLDGGSHGSIFFSRGTGFSSSDGVFLPNILGVKAPEKK